MLVFSFLCHDIGFIVAIEDLLSRHSSFALYLDHCHDRVKDCRDSFLHNLLQ